MSEAGQDLEQFLEPAPGIGCEHPEVMALARRTVTGAADDLEAAGRLFEYVRDTVAYSPYVPFHRMDDYLAVNTLERGRGYCVQKSAVLVAMARAIGIPARLGFADIRNHQLPEGLAEMLGSDLMVHHCYAQLFAGGRWLSLTPSFERELCGTRGWRVVEFDPQGKGMLWATDLGGGPHISYLRDLGWQAGVPLNDILAAWREEYGEDRVEAWIAAVEQGGNFHPGGSA